MGVSQSKEQPIDIMYVGLDNSGKSTLIPCRYNGVPQKLLK